MPLEGDELATLEVDARGHLAVSTSRRRAEAGPGGFDAMESSFSDGEGHHNLYAHRSYGVDARGRVMWEHRTLRIVRVIPEGWAALTDRHDLVLIDHEGTATRRRRLRGDSWRICGWRAGEPVVTSEFDATWVDPYVYRVRDRQLQHANEAGHSLGAIDLPRAPFDDECRRNPPPPGLPDSFLFPTRMRPMLHRDRRSLIATHRSHMAWVASLGLDGELSWVRLLDHACCNSACIVDDRIVHSSSCGRRVTLLDGDGRVLASRHLPHSLDTTVSDGRGGFCVRGLDGIYGLDESLESTWSIRTDGIPHATAHDGVIYVVAGRPGPLVVAAYALA
jgi:hypothetical protein